MTPKEKAKELILDFSKETFWDSPTMEKQKEISKNCALLCIEKINEEIGGSITADWWLAVKNEILNTK